MVIVLAHWAEHLLQAFQIYALGWPVPEARGALGHFFPWLIKSETLHYGYALVMLIGPVRCCARDSPASRNAAGGRSRSCIQFFHHIEHALLQMQAITGHNLFDRPVPTSIVQLWIPRVELHLFYNTIVFIPMVIAMYYHLFPTGVGDDAEVHVRVAPWSCAPRPDRTRTIAGSEPRARSLLIGHLASAACARLGATGQPNSSRRVERDAFVTASSMARRSLNS